jgi:hypothetical protein
VFPRSSFASLSPSTTQAGAIYVALKCYFDGSAKPGTVLALGAIAADENAWANLEHDWLTLLRRLGLPYMHMKELVPRKAPFFSHLDKQRRDWLINAAATLLSEHQQDGQITSFSCAVDLAAYQKLKPILGLPDPARICVRNIFPKMVECYGSLPDHKTNVMDLFFDRGEGFMKHLDADWKSDECRKRYPMWNIVRTIAPVAMQQTPGVQMADVIAWSRANQHVGPNGSKWYAVSMLNLHMASRHSGLFDHAKLATYPPFAVM